METFTFQVDSALLSELGEKLVETVHVALVELIKNSYDADATKVTVKFSPSSQTGGPKVCVEDNGRGMTLEDVNDYWMRIATTNKSLNSISEKFGRPKTGSKGIGRFCCRRLGMHLNLISTAINKEKMFETTEIDFDWKNFKTGTNVSSIECIGKHSVSKTGKTGTVLTIHGSKKDEWRKGGYEFLRRHLAILVANRGIRRQGYQEDPGFNILLEAPNFKSGVKDLREDLIKGGWGTVDAKVNNQGHAVCVIEAVGIEKKTITSIEKFPNLKDTTLHFGILPLNTGKEDLKDPKILSKTNLKALVEDWGGIHIRYSGFRVYLGDDDWLGIDKERGLRQARPNDAKDQLFSFASKLAGVDPHRALLNRLSMRNHIGDVEIGEEASGFEMKANREGFINSPSLSELKNFVKFAVNWASIYREHYTKTKIEKSILDATTALEKLTKENIPSDSLLQSAVQHIKKEVQVISNYLPQTERKATKELFIKATDAILKHEESNKEELHHLRLIASTSSLLLIFSHEAKSLLGMLETNSTSLSFIEKHLKGEALSTVREIKESLLDCKTRFKDLINMTSLIQIDSKSASPKKLSLLEHVRTAEKCFHLILKNYSIHLDYEHIQNNVLVGPIMEAELYAILLNVLSNSIKAVIAAGNTKKINISASQKDGKVIIDVKDTGIGLAPSEFQNVFNAFKADPQKKLYVGLKKNLNPEDSYIVGTGSGLGLSIVKEILHLRQGSVEFIKPDANWKTQLRITV